MSEKFKNSLQLNWKIFVYQLVGIAIAILLWQFFTSHISNPQFAEGFSPLNTLHELINLIQSGTLFHQIGPSLMRVTTGLAFAILIGIPVGLLIGYFRVLSWITNTVFQFIRMTSPLAWMPIAIIMFGVGDQSVAFLIAVASVWPIIINTAHGVRHVDPAWPRVVSMLGGRHGAILMRAIIPAVIPDILTGLRIAIGIAWVILVPAEMLGVSSGLGYSILDARDRFNYGELTAIILVIGFLGAVSDSIIRFIQHKFSWSHKRED